MAKKTATTGKTTSASATRRPAEQGTVPQGSALASLHENAVKGSSAAEKRAAVLVSRITLRKTRIAEDVYDIGEALRELQKKKLGLSLGHASFAVVVGG